MRLDQFLVKENYFSTRSRAQDAIKEGCVHINHKVITKNSYDVADTDHIEVISNDVAFASRAGYKLFDVLEPFQIDLKNRVCIDVGASTGGFSDVCLQQNAALVYAVDVGKDQLISRLKEDPRIVNMESTNCRYLQRSMFDHPITFACMDVSFISIRLILPALFKIMDNVEIVALIKPQFEAGKQGVGKNGIVKDEKVHIQVLKDMVDFVYEQGYYVKHLCASSILGRDGNKEFIMHIVSEPCQHVFSYRDIVKHYEVKR